MYFFTSDEHYGHANIIKYCNRPFIHVDEMDEELIKRHNDKVTRSDTTIHLGDFYLRRSIPHHIINRLNGRHMFIPGSHDHWLVPNTVIILNHIHEFKFKKLAANCIICCHYAMRVWPKSHYNSWHLFGHSHGRLEPIGKSWDVGVDKNNFEPLSVEEIVAIMNKRPDNPNIIHNRL